MTYKLGTASKRNLATIHRVGQRIVERAITITDVDFSAVNGIRTRAEQRKNITDGVSWTMDSYHLPDEDGNVFAIDIYPWVDGETSHEESDYNRVAKAMFQAAQEVDMEGYRLEWGGFWNKPQNDKAHWQIIV